MQNPWHENPENMSFGCAESNGPTKSIVLAFFLEASSHQVSHQSHSWGSDLIGTWWIMLLGRSWERETINQSHWWSLFCVGTDGGEELKNERPTWSRLDRLLGSWLRPWYWPLSRSPAAIFLNFFRSTTYRALRSTHTHNASFIHPGVVLMLYALLSFSDYKRRFLNNIQGELQR